MRERHGFACPHCSAWVRTPRCICGARADDLMFAVVCRYETFRFPARAFPLSGLSKHEVRNWPWRGYGSTA